MAPRRKSRFVSNRRGAAALEYGLILPALLLFLIGIIDVGRLVWTYTTLHRAAEAAARCGAINADATNPSACRDTAEIQARAREEAWGLDIPASAFTVSMESCGVRVTGVLGFASVIPALGLDLSATACYPVEVQ